MRLFAFLSAVVLFLAAECSPKVAPTTLKELTAHAELIVVGKVVRVTNVKGLRVAEVQVAATIKGNSPTTIYYLAQPTWVCDTSAATIGEETLFFFSKYKFDPNPASIAYVKPTGSAGRYTIQDDATPVGAFKEPIGFREQITALVDAGHFWQVSWAGRGRMPIRNLHGTKYATLWIDDVRLPAGIPTVSGPEHKYSFIRSAPLGVIVAFVKGQARTNAGAHGR